MSDDLVKRLRDWSEYDEGKINDAREEAADRIEQLMEQAHYANGVADLAMKHRNYAEQRVEQLEAALKKAAERLDEIGQNDDAANAYAALEGKKDD